VNQPEIASLRQRLSAVQNTGNNAVSNIGRVRTNLDWQVTSQQGIDARLSAVQKRLQTQMELLGQYANFLNTVNDRFATTDRNLRDQARDVLYRIEQIKTSGESDPPRASWKNGLTLSAIAGVSALFGPGVAGRSARLGLLRNRVNELGSMNQGELFYETIVSGSSGMWGGIQELAKNSTPHAKTLAENVGDVFLGVSMFVGGIKVFSAFRDSRNAGNCVISSVGVAAEKTVEVGGGILGAKKGAATGAKWGMKFGPKGAVIGGLVGGVIGSGAGAELGRRVAGGAKAVGNAIASFNPFRRRR